MPSFFASGQDQESPSIEWSSPQPSLQVPKGRLKLSWGSGNNLTISGLASEQPGTGGTVVQVTWGSLNAIQRRLAFDLVRPFDELQLRKAQLGGAEDEGFGSEWQEGVLEYSRTVRSILNSAIAEALKEGTRWGATGLELVLASAVWQLVELFYADTRPHGIFTEELVDWLKAHHRVLKGNNDLAHTELRKQVQNTAQPHLLEQYWPTIAQLVAVGWADEAIDLLMAHGSTDEKEKGVVEVVRILIRQMPHLRPGTVFEKGEEAPEGDFASLPEYHQARETWRRKLQKLLLDTEKLDWCGKVTRAGLETVLKILLGDLRSIRPHTAHWAELMVANLLHHQPHMKAHAQLLRLVQECMKEFGQSSLDESKLSILDRIVLAVLRYETEDLMYLTAKASRSWVLAHLSEVLAVRTASTAELLSQPREGLGNCGLQEYYRLQYAKDLSSSLATWQVAVVYLSTCPVLGKGTLEGLLEGLPVTSDHRLALKALEVCKQKGLPGTAAHICRLLGVHYWQKGHHGAGVAWLQRARDDQQLAAITEQLLAKAMSGREGDQTLEEIGPLLDSLGGAGGAPQGGSLAFLQRYRELRGCLEGLGRGGLQVDGIRKAARCVVQLMSPGMAPQRLWAAVLKEALPLVEWKDGVVFGVAETHLLMTCLQELRTSHRREELVKESEWANLEMLDLALAWNLGRAFLLEASQ